MIINRLELYRIVKLASGIAGANKLTPILQHVLLRLTPGKITVSATDLVVSLTGECPARGLTADAIIVNARDFADLIAQAPGDDVELTIGDNHHATIKSGKVKYQLVGASDRDFPAMPKTTESTWVTVESAVIREMLDRTMFAVTDDATRTMIAGVYLSGNTATSTDGHRVCMAKRLTGLPDRGALVPEKGAMELSNLAAQGPTLQIVVCGEHMFARQDSTTISVKLLNAQFPAAAMVELASAVRPSRLIVHRGNLMAAMKRAKMMATEVDGVKFTLGGHSIKLTCVNASKGNVEEEIDGTYEGKPMEIGFNPRYLVDLMSKMTADEVVMSFDGPLDPAMIRPASGDDYTGIVMPMRVA